MTEPAPELSQLEYHDLRVLSGLYQRCRRCGTCEMAGGFCSRCTSADYVTDIHQHGDRSLGQPCPLASLSVAPGAVKSTYHHLPGASLRRFPSDPDRR